MYPLSLGCRLTRPSLGITNLLFSLSTGTFPLLPIGMLAVYYYIMTLWTYALPVP